MAVSETEAQLARRASVLEGERDELREKLDAALGREGSLALGRNEAIRERDRLKRALEEIASYRGNVPRAREHRKIARAALESLSGEGEQ